MIAGIDPGLSGGWAILDPHGKFFAAGRYEDWVKMMLFVEDITLAAIEAVSVWGSDSKAQTFSRSKLLENAAWWAGVFEGHGVKVIKPHPRSWKALFKLNLSPGVLRASGRSVGDKVKANMSLELARRMWPSAPLRYAKDNGVADALLLAEYARRTGQIKEV